MKVTHGGPYDAEKEYTVITVSNRGRRSLTFDKAGYTIRMPEKSQPFTAVGDCANRGPQEVGEGKSAMWMIEQDEDFDPADIEEFWVIAQTGQAFHGYPQEGELKMTAALGSPARRPVRRTGTLDRPVRRPVRCPHQHDGTIASRTRTYKASEVLTSSP